MGAVISPCAVQHEGGGTGIALRRRGFPEWNGPEEWLVEWDDLSRTWERRKDLVVLQ